MGLISRLNDKKMDDAQESRTMLLGFVLRENSEWDLQQFSAAFKEEWGIALDDSEAKGDTLVATVDGLMLAVSLMEAPIPEGEAEYYAQTNYLWDDAVEVTKRHRAHILVTVKSWGERQDMAVAQLFVKATSTLLGQPNSLGLYANGTVYEPEFYRDFASMMHDEPEALPVMDLLWFGILKRENDNVIYTYGLRAFGLEEMEVLAGKDVDLNEVRMLLCNVADYVIRGHVELHDGETLGYTEEQKLRITLSEGIGVDGKTLKIAWE